MRSAKNLVFGILAFSGLAFAAVPTYAQRAASDSDVAAPGAKGHPATGTHEQRMRQHREQHQHGQGERAHEHAMRNMASGCPMMQSGAQGEHNH